MPNGQTHSRFHGRVAGAAQLCAQTGCTAAGEFRAPAEPPGPGRDGPPRYRYFCLDHVRAFNAGYDYFAGMDAQDILAAQHPASGWERETRAFAGAGADPAPAWADFQDPLDAIATRFHTRGHPQTAQRSLSGQDRKALKTLELSDDADRASVRAAYTRLARKYHPDHNDGKRSHEQKLQDVIAAYAHLYKSNCFS
jgi:hypothetical protein